MRSDPPRRRDGRCARKGCTKPLHGMTDQHRRYGTIDILLDPFCSTECCKLYHGVHDQKRT